MKLNYNLSVNRFQWAAQKVKELLSQQPNAMYYDVGAGENQLVKGIDPQKAISKSFDLFPKSVDVEFWDIEQVFPYAYPPANIVTFLEVVEHLNNPWLCLKNIAATIAPGGHLILTTPNPGWSSSRISLLMKGYLTCFTQSDLDLNHHVFTAWPHIVEKLLSDNKLEIIEYVTLDGKTKIFDGNLKLTSAVLQIPLRLVKKIIEYTNPAAIGMSYGIVARKIE
jgi:2-polyprenyl-3-methyl-5-hydroxy-6-metoxy-1,4-benzoquinol methylase